MDMLKNKKSKTGIKKKRLSAGEINERDKKTVRGDVEKILWDIVYNTVDRKFEIELNAKIIDLGMKCLVESVSDIIDLYFFPHLSIDEETDNEMWMKDEPAEPAVMDLLQVDRLT